MKFYKGVSLKRETCESVPVLFLKLYVTKYSHYFFKTPYKHLK